MKEKLTVSPQFFGVFPTDRVSKVTKDVNIHFFIHILPARRQKFP